MQVGPDRRARLCQLRPIVRRGKMRRIVLLFLRSQDDRGPWLGYRLPIVF